MDKKKKGLADQGDGDFILNESGTSINTDHAEGMPKERSDNANYNEDDEPYIPPVADEQKDNTD